ncbi:MAG: Gfo/Idh/MocA family oxidoreductase [Clostridiaceae bacterium]|nr:Gfo/Idh/MocA family oxidoreductase [Clostridiaceae bacterium]
MTRKFADQIKPLEVAIVGCGRVARKHLRAVTDNRRYLVPAALIDPNRAAAEKLRDRLPKKWARELPYFASLGEYLALRVERRAGATEEKTERFIVAINTPSGSHYELAAEALVAGADLLIEKPITLVPSEGYRLIELAAERRRLIATGHIYRYFPLVAEIRSALERGVWGRPLAAELSVCWGHSQAYYDQAAWRGTWSRDGGALMNQTVHALDLLCYLLDSPLASVSGQIDRVAHDMEAEDIGLAIGHTVAGTMVKIFGTTATSPQRKTAEFTLHCENGTVIAGICGKRPYFKIHSETSVGKRHRILAAQWRARRENGLGMMIRGWINPHTAIYTDLAKAIIRDICKTDGAYTGAASSADEPIGVRADALSAVRAVENILAIYASAKANGCAVSIPVQGFTLEEMCDYSFAERR